MSIFPLTVGFRNVAQTLFSARYAQPALNTLCRPWRRRSEQKQEYPLSKKRDNPHFLALHLLLAEKRTSLCYANHITA
jgi:hypothetical protein